MHSNGVGGEKWYRAFDPYNGSKTYYTVCSPPLQIGEKG